MFRMVDAIRFSQLQSFFDFPKRFAGQTRDTVRLSPIIQSFFLSHRCYYATAAGYRFFTFVYFSTVNRTCMLSLFFFIALDPFLSLSLSLLHTAHTPSL